MRCKMWLAVVAVIAFGSVAFGQTGNAREDAMGNINLMKDISQTLDNPAYMNFYGDNAQVSIGTGGVIGPAIGVKSLGPVNIGIAANRGWFCTPGFYAGGRALMSAAPFTANLTAGQQNIPHLLVGMDLSGFKLGADLFDEVASYSHKIDDNAAGATTTTEETQSIMDPGFHFGMDMDISGFELGANLGLSFPSISGDYKVTTAAGTAETKANSLSFIHYTVGAKADIKSPMVDVTGGLQVNGEYTKFRTEVTPAGGATTTTKFPTSGLFNLMVFLGVGKELQDNLYVGLEDYFVARYTSITPDSVAYAPAGLRATDATVITNILAAGVEKKWTPVLWIDTPTVRVGVNYAISDNMSGVNTSAATDKSSTYTESTKAPAVWSDVVPTFGIGARKGIFQFDASFTFNTFLNLFKWANGTNAGNDVARATVTLDFPHVAGKAAASSGSETAPTAKPAY